MFVLLKHLILSSEADTELAAICSESTALSANFAEVTASVVSLAVLIAPVAILPPVIVVSAIWSAVTCPSSMCFVKIEFCAIFVPSIALSCIFAVAIELPANCAVANHLVCV